MSANAEALSNAVQRILVPNIVLFFIGWLMGATKVLLPPSVYVLNMTALYWIFPCAVFSGFLNFQFTGFDFFFFLFNIIAKFVMLIPAIVPYCFYKINLRMVCTLWLTAVYNDAITYGLYYLSVFYTEPRMMTWISLSTVPSNIIFFPIIVFMMEYQDYKRSLRKSSTGTSDTSAGRIVLSIVLRVIKNPLVWAGVSGIILNQAVLGPKGKFPVWFTEIFILSRACTMPMNMFLLGVFTATYGPIHTKVMKVLCCLVSPIKNLCCPSSDEEVASSEPASGSKTVASPPAEKESSSSSSTVDPGSVLHAAEGEKEVQKPPTWGDKLSELAEEGIQRQGEGMWVKGTDGSADMELEIDTEVEAIEEEIEGGRAEPRNVKPKPKVKEIPLRVVAAEPPPPPAAAAAAAAAPAIAPAPAPAPGAPKTSDDYKFNPWLLITEIIIRHVISPAVMLLLCLIFSPILTVIQRHCMVVMTSFGTGGPVFVLGRQYNAYPGEAAVTQVAGAFILNVVSFIVFYYICQAIWPL